MSFLKVQETFAVALLLSRMRIAATGLLDVLVTFEVMYDQQNEN